MFCSFYFKQVTTNYNKNITWKFMFIKLGKLVIDNLNF